MCATDREFVLDAGLVPITGGGGQKLWDFKQKVFGKIVGRIQALVSDTLS